MSAISIDTLVSQWLDVDVNTSTRDEIIQLQEKGDVEELEKRLRNRIQFGTAGLRARMEAGFSRMNDVTVLQASQGLAAYVLKQGHQAPSIVIGHDHRDNSEKFAQITASAFLLRGIKVYFLGSTGRKIVPTPLVPFAVDHYGASCGVMITASHNPAADNGYKVYYSNGCQIIPPHDKGIAQEILESLVPLTGSWDLETNFSKSKSEGLLVECRTEMFDKYMNSINEKLIKSKLSADFKFIYTAMHGVGLESIQQVARLLGVDDLIAVKEQAEPDAKFPTVQFPNPEEKGALDLAMKKAEELGIDLVIANDPDADRFSAAVKHEGTWRQLTGNEIGFLFAEYVIGHSEKELLSKTYLLNSTVSSQMIKSMADGLGFHYVDTLTGFKWIGNKAIDLEGEGFHVPFAYEEAIGFMFSVVHDKDGVSAAAIFLQMADEWKKKGTNAIAKLEEGYKRFGYFKECNGYYKVPELSTTSKVFSEIRKNYANPYPKTLGDYEVTSWRDLTIGFDSTTSDNVPGLPSDPSSEMITCLLKSKNDELIRFTARGSGTEPKLKVYIESKSDSEEAAIRVARDVWDTLKELWFKPEKYGMFETV